MNEVNEFLYCSTPQAWIDAVAADLPTLLIDHANCEKKAASTALNLIFRYVDKPELSMKLSKLAREELRHFEQVLTLLQKRNSISSMFRPPDTQLSYARASEPASLIV